MGATNQDAKAQQNSGNITQSREILGRVREAQHMDLAQHCDRNGLPEAQREGEKRHSEAFGVCWLRGSVTIHTKSCLWIYK